MADGNKPAYIARSKVSDDSDAMQSIGAAWPFKEGDGWVVKLNALPIDWDGTLILVKPKADVETAPG